MKNFWPPLICLGVVFATGYASYKGIPTAVYFGRTGAPYSIAASACMVYAGIRLLALAISRGRQKDLWIRPDAFVALSSIALAASIYLFIGVSSIRSSNSHVTLGKLGGARSVLGFYYEKNKKYPISLDEAKRFAADFGGWPKPRDLCYSSSGCPHGPPKWVVRDAKTITDSGDWVYVNNPKSPDFGLAYIDCTHLSSTAKGKPWTSY